MPKTNRSFSEINLWAETLNVPKDYFFTDVRVEGNFLRVTYSQRDGIGRIDVFLNGDSRPVAVEKYDLEPEPKVFFSGTSIEMPKSRPERFIIRVWIMILYVRSFFGRKKNG